VRELKTKDLRYYISYILRDLAVGDKFKPSELHISILPWFALETDELPFLNWFYKQFKQLKSFDAVTGERRMFGPNKDVPVSILEPKEKFMQMHLLALSWFGEVGARWAERDPYVGDDYIPHISQRQGYKIDDGQQIHINSLILFKASRHEDHIRQVAAKVLFDEQN
jgi:hypothetical protein